MRAFSKLILWFLLSTMSIVKSVNVGTKGNSKEIANLGKTRATKNTFTDVVNNAFCESNLSPEDKMGKKTLEEVHSYAELKHDPRASLPDSFTVCSTVRTTGCQSYYWPKFFHILDNNRGQFLVPGLNHGSIDSRLSLNFHENSSPLLFGKVLPLFPSQWMRSCMAVNTTSGLIHWVVDGTLVLSEKFAEVKESKNRPKDLSRKLVLGASLYVGSWFASTVEVTNLNIYSSREDEELDSGW